MTHGHTAASLIAFRDKVAAAFRAKRVRCPVHFPGGNEDQLLRVFEGVRPCDWVFSGWRSMYHALLKGCPEEWVFGEILGGRSMYLMSKEHRLLCSSIVGGVLPIACGVAMGLKRERETPAHQTGMAFGYSSERYEFEKSGGPTVWVFVGDMTASTGLFHETVQYALGHNLPMRFVVEDNGYSTNAPTRAVWRSSGPGDRAALVDGYTYERTMPHVGLQEKIAF